MNGSRTNAALACRLQQLHSALDVVAKYPDYYYESEHELMQKRQNNQKLKEGLKNTCICACLLNSRAPWTPLCPTAIPTGVVMKPSALRAHLVHLHNAVRDVAGALRKSGYWSALEESDSFGKVGSRVRSTVPHVRRAPWS